MNVSRYLAIGVMAMITACDRPPPAEPPKPESESASSATVQTKASTAPDADRGKAYYTTCAGCHGNFGEGNYGMHGPNLTLLDPDYLLTQLRNFRTEIRGGTADFYGWQMNGRTKALPDDLALEDVIAFIETLPDALARKTLNGDLARGQEIYAQQCAACHGPHGEGVATLKAPRLAGLDDWYQLQQLRNFRAGVRGVVAGDAAGQQMIPFADALADEDTLTDVVTYIATFADK